MNPVVKALASLLVLGASAMGSSLGHGGLGGLPFHPASEQSAGGDGNQTSGNQTGNGTSGSGNSTGNQTGSGGNATGNSTGNQTASGNETSDGNQTASGNQTADGNETATDDAATDDVPTCTVAVDDWGGYEVTSSHHEWEWLVSPDVRRLTVEFDSSEGVPLGLSDHPDVRLTDGQGRTIAHSSSSEASLDIDLHRGVDALANGEWRLTYESAGAFGDYDVHVAFNC
jgi:hypothetical protein